MFLRAFKGTRGDAATSSEGTQRAEGSLYAKSNPIARCDPAGEGYQFKWDGRRPTPGDRRRPEPGHENVHPLPAGMHCVRCGVQVYGH